MLRYPSTSSTSSSSAHSKILSTTPPQSSFYQQQQTQKSKRVSFAQTNVTYSPVLSTPSPAGSDLDSLPSSPDIRTPSPVDGEAPAADDDDDNDQSLYAATGYATSAAYPAFTHPASALYPAYPSSAPTAPVVLDDAAYAGYTSTPYPYHASSLLFFDGLEPSSYPSSYSYPSSSPKPPPAKEVEMQIHCCLAYDAEGGSPPQVCHDLSLPPPLAEVGAAVLGEAATFPPLQALAITYEHPEWVVEVRPLRKALLGHDGYDGYGTQQAYVTVHDVLECLYRDLRKPVTRAEYAMFVPEVQARVNAAYFARVARLTELGVEEREREREASKGVKRIDYLMGVNRFNGLTISPSGGPGMWELNVAVP